MIPVRQVVILLLLLQAMSGIFLWSLNAVGSVNEGRFAVFLAMDLLSFAMAAYIYTHDKWGELVSRAWILAGVIGLIVLLLSSLYFP
jgi:uncharacterized membrane protein YozB (DUF420 family)